MFNIVQVTVGGKASTCLLVGGKPGNQFLGPSNPLGPQGCVYHLILPDFGYIKFTDVGPNTQGGPGDWAVKFEGADKMWTYGGEGSANISIDSAGKKYTVTGGSGTVSGPVISW